MQKNKPWVNTFPDEFYEQLFKLKGWQYKPLSVKRPQVVGTITNDIIYERLERGVLDELKKRTPKDEKGRRKHHFHRLLTDNIGNPKLREHISNIIILMKASAANVHHSTNLSTNKWDITNLLLNTVIQSRYKQSPQTNPKCRS